MMEKCCFRTKRRQVNGQWMIPGGGLENGESEAACCIRELAEETGVSVETSACMLEIDEYYEDRKWVNKYFICKANGAAEMNPTKRELEAGMEPRWISVCEIKEIFSKHNQYAGKDEMRRGLYLREFTALNELV